MPIHVFLPVKDNGPIVARFFLFCLLSPASCLLPPAARADLIVFNDGFVVQGKIKQDKEFYMDPLSKRGFVIATLNGFYMVDDEARRILFSAKQVADATRQDFTQTADLIKRAPIVRLNGGLAMGKYWQVDEAQPFKPNWERWIFLKTSSGKLRFEQRIIELTPHHLRLDAKGIAWTAYHLTSELGPEVLRDLLRNQPRKPKASVQPTEADKRFQIFRFLLQAGWYDAAEKELEGIVTDFPKETKRITDARITLGKLQGLQLVDQIERASQAGRHKELGLLLTHFNRLKLDPELIGEKRCNKIQELREKFNEDKENLARAREFLQAVPKRILHTDYRQIFTQAAKLIEDGLNRDTVSRLDGFIGLSLQEARDRKNRKRPRQTPEELMSLAVSGWLQGNDAAEPDVKTALQFLEARTFVMQYLKTAEVGKRDKLLAAYKSQPHIALDELTQMLRFLPPPEPEPMKAIAKAGTKVQKRKANREDSPGKETTYYLQLPREYHHYRSYPVLVVLHSSNESADEMLDHWGRLASQYGFILAAPKWSNGKAAYQYSEDEHARVLDVLHDLRRKFQVDSDRVFLFGFEEGAKMALDVGLSHPDLFAGVIPMGAYMPKYYANHYWTNAQYLPFYFVDGSSNGENAKKNRKYFGDWVRHHYPALYVEYKGRGPEWFAGELPYMFDWMSCKKRAHPNRQLGKDGGGGLFGQEFRTMRPSDNRFYWLSTDEIKPGFLNDKESWKVTGRPATLTARIGGNNDIYVRTQGVKQVTLWFGPGMLNFEKPVTIRVNGGSPPWKKLVKPNLESLLKDLYERGDRQQVYFAKVGFQLR